MQQEFLFSIHKYIYIFNYLLHYKFIKSIFLVVFKPARKINPKSRIRRVWRVPFGKEGTLFHIKDLQTSAQPHKWSWLKIIQSTSSLCHHIDKYCKTQAIFNVQNVAERSLMKTNLKRSLFKALTVILFSLRIFVIVFKTLK